MEDKEDAARAVQAEVVVAKADVAQVLQVPKAVSALPEWALHLVAVVVAVVAVVARALKVRSVVPVAPVVARVASPRSSVVKSLMRCRRPSLVAFASSKGTAKSSGSVVDPL